MRDEDRSLGVALWEEASNCRKLLRSKAVVVNVSVKRRNQYVKYGLERRAQANLCFKHRKHALVDIKTGDLPYSRDKCEGNLLTARTVSGVEEAWRVQLRAEHPVGESPTETKRLKSRSLGGVVARKQGGGALRHTARRELCNAPGCNVQ
jgi:hypothetical protein